MDPRFEDLVAYLRGRKLLRRDETPATYADYLDELRPQLEALAADVCEEPVPVRRGPGRPRKEAPPCA